MQTLDNLTPAELRDLATRATNAAAVQEKAEAEKQQLADEAKKKAKIVFEHGPYSLKKDGTIHYERLSPYSESSISNNSVRNLVSLITDNNGEGNDSNSLLDFMVAYRQSLRDKKAKENVMYADLNRTYFGGFNYNSNQRF